jgi:hypothetical protein
MLNIAKKKRIDTYSEKELHHKIKMRKNKKIDAIL